MYAGVLETGTKTKSVAGREKDRGTVSNLPAKANEGEIETKNKMVGLIYYMRCTSLTELCSGLSRNVPSPH